MDQTPVAALLAAKNPPTKNAKKRPGRKPALPEPFYPVEPVVIQRIDKPRTHVNHSYRDFSQMPPETTKDTFPTDIADMSFSQKLFTLLTEPDAPRWIAWNPHGRSFRIIVPKLLEQSMLLQKYFGHNRYSSFLRQLTNYGFKHITKGVDRNSYYHEVSPVLGSRVCHFFESPPFVLIYNPILTLLQSFLNNRPHLHKYMPEMKDIRRQIADPDHEPDFYEISRRFPLSAHVNAVVSAASIQLPATAVVVNEEPLMKRQRLAGSNMPRVMLPSRPSPSAVSMALAMSRPTLRPQVHEANTRLQLLRLLQEQEQRRERILKSLLLRHQMR